MSEQRSGDRTAPGEKRKRLRDRARGTAHVPGTEPAEPDPARGRARVRAVRDLQTSEGIPDMPVPADDEQDDTATAEPEAEQDDTAEPGAEAEQDDTAEPEAEAEQDETAEAEQDETATGEAGEAPAGDTPDADEPQDEADAASEEEVSGEDAGTEPSADEPEPGDAAEEPQAEVEVEAEPEVEVETGRRPEPVTAGVGQPEQDRRKEPRGGPLDVGRAPAFLVASSLGVLLVAFAYTGGRSGAAGATALYWIGQVVVFTPVVVRLLSRRLTGVAESFLLVSGLAVNQYLLKWMYSPDQFRFPDELQHWLATTTIIETGELFRPNPALPPAVHFPGLAELGAAVASMTGLPVSAAGLIVAGVAHLVFVGVLFICVLRASNSPAVAGVACVVYATALHYLFFSSMYLYQTAALPFFMLTVWAVRRWRTEGGRPFLVVAIGSMALTTVSHHVTAFTLIATLTLLGVTELWTERPRRWSALAMPAAALGVTAAWILLVARDVIGYLEAPVDQVLQTATALIEGTRTESTAAPEAALGQLALQGAGLVGLLVLFLAVGRDMLLRADRDTWRWAALIGGVVFFGGNAVRFLGQSGPEIAGRLSTFTYIPISIIAAIGLVRAVQVLPSRQRAGSLPWFAVPERTPKPQGRALVYRTAAGTALITLLMLGARAGGWPPQAQLLPGPYLAGGFERAVDIHGVRAAEWQRDLLGPGNRVGGDVTSVSLASTYGRQDPVREVAPLFRTEEWGLADEDLVEELSVGYLVVDRRLGTQLPQSDSYFENDPEAGRITRPLNTRQIAKFDTLTDVERVYDNGTVRIYRMGVSQ